MVGLVLLLERDRRGAVDREQRRQQQRQPPHAGLYGQRDQRRDHDDREVGHDEVAEVLEEQLAERLARVRSEDARDDAVVGQEVDEPRERHRPQVRRADHVERARVGPVAGCVQRTPREQERDRVLRRVDQSAPPGLAHGHVRDDGGNRLRKQRRPRTPEEHDREREGDRRGDAFAVRPGRHDGAQFAEDDQRDERHEGTRLGHTAFARQAGQRDTDGSRPQEQERPEQEGEEGAGEGRGPIWRGRVRRRVCVRHAAPLGLVLCYPSLTRQFGAPTENLGLGRSR